MSKIISFDDGDDLKFSLKIDAMGKWVEQVWISERPDTDWLTLWTTSEAVHTDMITNFDDSFDADGYHLANIDRIDSAVTPTITKHLLNGELSHKSGAFIYRFVNNETDTSVEVLIVASYVTYYAEMVTLVCLPTAFAAVWTKFANEFIRRANAMEPESRVVVIGGHSHSFVPTTDWDEIILPEKLRTDLLEDVRSFFEKGVEVYKRLNLKPFRKLLLAGIPGTGKTMICSALAKWALDNQYLVIYISSADHDGATFSKIQYALDIASKSSVPTLLILEELDAYLHAEEKAQVLNVLDGAESAINERGTLLVSTTNYPEAIDERVLKRPGRLDRIFIIPEVREHDDAIKILHKYLGNMWQEAHIEVAMQMVGYPGAFVREVAVYALTQVAYGDLPELTLEMLQNSFDGLKEQIDQRDDFLAQRNRRQMGLSPALPHNNGSKAKN